MNIYIVLLLLISVAVFCESSKCKGRECAAKRNYLEFLNRYEKFKEIPKDANEPQRRRGKKGKCGKQEQPFLMSKIYLSRVVKVFFPVNDFLFVKLEDLPKSFTLYVLSQGERVKQLNGDTSSRYNCLYRNGIQRLHRNAWKGNWRERKMNVLVNRGVETTTTTTTTTTKSPLQILKDRSDHLNAQNPKGIKHDSFYEMKKQIEDLQKKYLTKRCTTNDDCANGTCCMIEVTDGTCQKPPHRKNQQCSDFCPCKDNHNLECKMSETTENGLNDYIKKCLPKTVPELTNLDLIKRFKNAKQFHKMDRIKRHKDKKVQAKQAA